MLAVRIPRTAMDVTSQPCTVHTCIIVQVRRHTTMYVYTTCAATIYTRCNNHAPCICSCPINVRHMHSRVLIGVGSSACMGSSILCVCVCASAGSGSAQDPYRVRFAYTRSSSDGTARLRYSILQLVRQSFTAQHTVNTGHDTEDVELLQPIELYQGMLEGAVGSSVRLTGTHIVATGPAGVFHAEPC